MADLPNSPTVPHSGVPQFGPGLFAFFVALRGNNSREWFQANKSWYERDVRDPMLGFISALAPRLREIAPEYVADPRPVGGSMFRLHRDTRFSKDKTPYKLAVAAHFRHATGKDAHAPGFYLHLGPGEVMAGAGLWQPPPPTLLAVRTAIAERSAEWAAATSGLTLWSGDATHGQSPILKRVPAGFDPAHPFEADLRRKDFVVMEPLSEADAVAPDFLDRYVAILRKTLRLNQFLLKASS
jgi:uncharacterized protein (TIGR02453 family)